MVPLRSRTVFQAFVVCLVVFCSEAPPDGRGPAVGVVVDVEGACTAVLAVVVDWSVCTAANAVEDPVVALFAVLDVVVGLVVDVGVACTAG
jgi:hypothetical protein